MNVVLKTDYDEIFDDDDGYSDVDAYTTRQESSNDDPAANYIQTDYDEVFNDV